LLYEQIKELGLERIGIWPTDRFNSLAAFVELCFALICGYNTKLVCQ